MGWWTEIFGNEDNKKKKTILTTRRPGDHHEDDDDDKKEDKEESQVDRPKKYPPYGKPRKKRTLPMYLMTPTKVCKRSPYTQRQRKRRTKPMRFFYI